MLIILRIWWKIIFTQDWFHLKFYLPGFVFGLTGCRFHKRFLYDIIFRRPSHHFRFIYNEIGQIILFIRIIFICKVLDDDLVSLPFFVINFGLNFLVLFFFIRVFLFICRWLFFKLFIIVISKSFVTYACLSY